MNLYVWSPLTPHPEPGLGVFFPKICHSSLPFQNVKLWQWPPRCGRHITQMLFTKATCNLWHVLLTDIFPWQKLKWLKPGMRFQRPMEAVLSEKWGILELDVVLDLIDIARKCSSVATCTHKIEYFSFHNQGFIVSRWGPRDNPPLVTSLLVTSDRACIWASLALLSASGLPLPIGHSHVLNLETPTWPREQTNVWRSKHTPTWVPVLVLGMAQFTYRKSVLCDKAMSENRRGASSAQKSGGANVSW